jgi:hypothetical protein
LTWFLIEADVTARETPEETRLSFFTVLILRRLDTPPSAADALDLVDDYLREVHAPFSWDAQLIAVDQVAER